MWTVFLLADLAPSDKGDLLLYIIMGLFALIGAAASVAKIYEAFFKKPEKRNTEALTVGEFHSFRELVNSKFVAVEVRMGEVERETRDLLRTLTAELRSIHRTLGRLEGKAKHELEVDHG